MCLTPSSKFPFSNLPSEIKIQIFMLDADIDIDNNANPTRAVTLSAVCNEWRNIVWSLPQLWSKIIMHWSTPPVWCKRSLAINTVWANNKRIFDMYVRNSSNHPLYISMNLQNTYDYWLDTIPVDSEILLTLDSIKKEAYRLKYLDITLNPDRRSEIPRRLKHITRSHLPMLEIAKLQSSDEFLGYVHNLNHMFKKSPQLHTLSLSVISYPPDALASCKQVTNLHLYSMSLVQTVLALRNLPNLTHITCKSIIHPKDHPLGLKFDDDATYFVHHSLISIQIEDLNYEQNAFALLLSSISCPSLRNLDVQSLWYSACSNSKRENIILKAATKFLRLSNCPLESLNFATFKMNEDLWPLLDSVHTTVETVQLNSFYGDPRFWDMIPQLVTKMSSSSYFPNLIRLHIDQDRGPLDYSLIYHGLKKRVDSWPVGQEIRPKVFSVHLEYQREREKVDADVVEGLKWLGERGMDVSLTADSGRSHPVLRVKEAY